MSYDPKEMKKLHLFDMSVLEQKEKELALMYEIKRRQEAKVRKLQQERHERMYRWIKKVPWRLLWNLTKLAILLYIAYQFLNSLDVLDENTRNTFSYLFIFILVLDILGD